jgi:hypothetical protein
MRPFNPSTAVRASASPLRNVCCYRRRTVSSPISFSMPSVRQKSHATTPKMINPRAQSPLKPSSPSNGSIDPSPIPSYGSQKTHTAYIALGSNVGDRIGMIEKACNEMSARGIKVKRTSCLWETQPMYVLDQENFVNGACEVRASLFSATSAYQVHASISRYGTLLRDCV